MRIFLTGATGYIGSALTEAFLKAGHGVVALTRQGERARGLAALGAEPIVGDLKLPDSYRKSALEADTLIHAGFEYGPSARETDRIAVETLAECARGPGKHRTFIYTSGVWVLGQQRGQPADERTPVNPPPLVSWRPDHERLALGAGGGHTSAVVVRPGCVYGGGGGLYGAMIRSAVERRSIELVGDGENCWAAVYLEDLAELYRLVALKRPSREVFHAADGSADPMRRVAEALLSAAGGGSVSLIPLDQAIGRMGDFASALALDQRVTSAKAARELGWKPTISSAARHAATLHRRWREATSEIAAGPAR